MYSNPTHSLVLLCLPSTPVAFPKEKKIEIKAITLFLHLFLPLHHLVFCHSDIGSCCLSRSMSFGPNSFTSKYSLHWVVGLDQGFWFLLYHWYRTFTMTPLWHQVFDGRVLLVNLFVSLFLFLYSPEGYCSSNKSLKYALLGLQKEYMVNKHWAQQPQTGTGPQEQRAACLPTKNWTLLQAYVVLTKVFYVKASG